MNVIAIDVSEINNRKLGVDFRNGINEQIQTCVFVLKQLLTRDGPWRDFRQG